MRTRRIRRLIVMVWVAGVMLPGLAAVGAEPNVAPSWAPPSLSSLAAALEELPFDEFVETSYRLYLMRFPQSLTDLGFAEALGVRNDRLNDYSSGYLEETQQIEREILDRLLRFDREDLSPEEQINYDVCAWYWDDLVRGQAYADYSYPVSHFYFTSLDWALFDLLTEVHPFASAQDAEDFVTRLHGVDEQFGQIIDQMEIRAEAGIVVPRIMIDWALPQLRNLAYASARLHPFYVALEEGLREIDLSTEASVDLLAAAASVLTGEVIPAYRSLLGALEAQRASAPSGIGFGQYPGGEDFYAYALHHQNQTHLSPTEIHEIGLREVARLKIEMEQAALSIGVPEGASLSEIYSAAEEGGGTLSGPAILAEYERLLAAAQERVGEVFLRLPAAAVAVKPDPLGGYYSPAPLDGSRPAFFAAAVQGEQPRYRMATLTYHETIPGHHLQMALAREIELPLLRKAESLLGYTEGWALYAERLAWELGWHAEDPYGNLGRLSDEMMRAVRLVVDTGIHVLEWSFEDAVAYFAEHTGRSTGESGYNILRYAAWPGQSTSYMIGFFAILDLRARVQESAGAAFDLPGFHDVMLRNGALPLPLLERTVAEHYGIDL